MAFTYNIKNDIRYNQGREAGIEEGMEKGMEKATIERNSAFVLNLLQHTDLSDEKISRLANVTLDFVNNLRKLHSL